MTDDNARVMVSGLLALLERKAAESMVAERLRATRAHHLTVLIFERTAGLRITEITTPSGGTARVRLPDPEMVAGQTVFAYDVTLGAGEFRANPTTIQAVTDGPMLFSSAPVLAAIVAGSVQTPAGPVPYDAAASFKEGSSDFIGTDPGELIELLGIFEDLIASSRAELGIVTPAQVDGARRPAGGGSSVKGADSTPSAVPPSEAVRPRSTTFPEDQPW